MYIAAIFRKGLVIFNIKARGDAGFYGILDGFEPIVIDCFRLVSSPRPKHWHRGWLHPLLSVR